MEKRHISEILKTLTTNNWKRTLSCATYVYCRNPKGEWCVLAARRRFGDGAGKYNIPCGGKEPWDKTDIACAIRECREETGCRFYAKDFKEVGSINMIIGVGKEFAVVYKDTTTKHKVGKGDFENYPFRWMPISEVSTHHWAFGQDKKIMKYYDKIIAK